MLRSIKLGSLDGEFHIEPLTALIFGGIFIILVSIGLLYQKKRLRQKKRMHRLLKIGKMGEEDTIHHLSRIRGRKYILHNIYVPLKNGRSTAEIDIILIHKKGLFVVENKNYSGWIYGDEQELKWLQVQKRDGRPWERLFYNPIRQNQNHIRNLKYFLELEFAWEIPCYSVIVFNHKAKLKKIRIDSKELLVTESSKVRRRLNRKMRRMPRAFTKRQMDMVYQRLASLENPGKYVKKQHESYLKQKGFLVY